jgi:hypothetical protein
MTGQSSTEYGVSCDQLVLALWNRGRGSDTNTNADNAKRERTGRQEDRPLGMHSCPQTANSCGIDSCRGSQSLLE